MAMIPPKSHLFPAWMSLLEVFFFLDHILDLSVLQTLGANLEDQSADGSISLSMSPMSLRVIRSRSASDLKLTAVGGGGEAM